MRRTCTGLPTMVRPARPGPPDEVRGLFRLPHDYGRVRRGGHLPAPYRWTMGPVRRRGDVRAHD